MSDADAVSTTCLLHHHDAVAISGASPRSWVMRMVDMPRWRVSSTMRSMTAFWVVTSRPWWARRRESRRGRQASASAMDDALAHATESSTDRRDSAPQSGRCGPVSGFDGLPRASPRVAGRAARGILYLPADLRIGFSAARGSGTPWTFRARACRACRLRRRRARRGPRTSPTRRRSRGRSRMTIIALGGNRLAGPRLADDAYGLALGDGQRDALHRAHAATPRRELDGQVFTSRRGSAVIQFHPHRGHDPPLRGRWPAQPAGGGRTAAPLATHPACRKGGAPPPLRGGIRAVRHV